MRGRESDTRRWDEVIVAINYSVIFFIPKADRIASSIQVSGSWKAALGNLVLAVVIDYRKRDSLPISIYAAGHKYIALNEKLWFEIQQNIGQLNIDITFILRPDVEESFLLCFFGDDEQKNIRKLISARKERFC